MQSTSNVIPARRLLDERQAAELLAMSPRTLQLWRRSGAGPAFVKLGAAVRYELTVLDAFIAAGARRSTAHGGTA